MLDLKEAVSKLNISEFEALDYEDMKAVMPCLKYHITKDMEARVMEIYENKRQERYPELKKAVYYPELNQVDFLSEERIKKLDELLCQFRTGCYVQSRLTDIYGRDDLLCEKLYDFLCDHKITKKRM